MGQELSPIDGDGGADADRPLWATCKDVIAQVNEIVAPK